MPAANEQLTFADLPNPKLEQSDESGQALVDRLKGIHRQPVAGRQAKTLPIVPPGTPGPLSGNDIPF